MIDLKKYTVTCDWFKKRDEQFCIKFRSMMII